MPNTHNLPPRNISRALGMINTKELGIERDEDEKFYNEEEGSTPDDSEEKSEILVPLKKGGFCERRKIVKKIVPGKKVKKGDSDESPKSDFSSLEEMEKLWDRGNEPVKGYCSGDTWDS